MHDSMAPKGLDRYLPAWVWLRAYPSSKWLRLDLIAGFTAAAVVIPQAMAYAAIAGVPVQAGLYTALAPMIAYALLGASPTLSVSTTSTIAMLMATALALTVQPSTPAGYMVPAATLAVLTGGLLLLASLLRFGFLSNFISLPVLTGFKAGVGAVIFVSQLDKVLGFSTDQNGFFRTLYATLTEIDAIQWPTFAVAIATLGVLLLLPRVVPALPAPLIAVAAAVVASIVLNLEAFGVQLVGAVPSGLPAFSLPDLSLVSTLWPAALGVALMSFTESIAAARAFMPRGERLTNPNQELLALGVANVSGGLFQAMPAGGGTSQTAVNTQAGARSQVAALITSGVVVVTLLFLAPLVSFLPEATLGALVLVAAAGLVKVQEFRAIAAVRRMELWWAIAALFGVILLGTLQGILVAVLISVLNLLYLANHPPVYVLAHKPGSDVFRPLSPEHPEDETFPGLLMVRTEGRMHFASAPRAVEQLRALWQEAPCRVLAVDCSAVPDIEYTALEMLAELEVELRAGGTELWLVALNPVPLQLIQKARLSKSLYPGRLFINMNDALQAYLAQPQPGMEEK